MNYLEIIGKNLIHTQEVRDYIHWAMLKLEHGFETESIIALVSLLLEIFPDIVIAKQYFTQSIKETGLPYPSDKTAIYDPSQIIRQSSPLSFSSNSAQRLQD